MSVGKFVDVESLVAAWLAQQLGPDVRVVTKLPDDIEGQELIRVTRSPGSNDAQRSLPRVDIEGFAPNRVRMWQLAGRANDALARLSGDLVEYPVGEGGDMHLERTQVDHVNTVTDPVPGYWSPTVERSVAVYELEPRVF